MADTQQPSVEERMANMEAAFQSLAKENAAMKKQLAQAEKKDEPKPKPVIPAEAFEVDGKKFKFCVASFVFNKETITAQDALTDKDILAQLVAIRSGVIKAVL